MSYRDSVFEPTGNGLTGREDEKLTKPRIAYMYAKKTSVHMYVNIPWRQVGVWELAEKKGD